MRSNELIQRYSIGICSEEEVNELERRLREDEKLQDEFLREAEIDAHLRQEAQLGVVDAAPLAPAGQQSQAIWKWVSGVSTLAATVLLALMILNFPPQQKAMAYPSLGNLTVEISSEEDSIWAAAAAGNLHAIRNQLGNQVSVDAKEASGLTPLHVAALFGQSEVAQLLLSSGANVSLTDGEGNTALHMAAFMGRTDIVRVLLNSGADPTVRNHLGFNSVDNVAVRWNVDLEAYYHEIEKALDKPLDLNRIKAERPKILALLTSADVASARYTPTTSIWQAVMVGNSAAVEQHIAAGSDLDMHEELGGSTPLMLAAIYGRHDIASTLIDAGADLEARNKSGGTALHQACSFCRPEIVKLLLHSGADSNATNNEDRTPLSIVTQELDAELIAINKFFYDWLHLDFDLDDIKASRIQIAKILNQHEQEGNDE
jgi:ankyrin repeat protein